MTRSEKAAVIEAIKANADRASFAVLTEFKGMTVEELTNLRVNLRKAGGEFYVVKNTLARIAFTGGTHDVVKDKFHDNSAIALGFDDPVAVAKALSDFAKQSKQGTAPWSAARHHERRAHQFCFAVRQRSPRPALCA